MMQLRVFSSCVFAIVLLFSARGAVLAHELPDTMGVPKFLSSISSADEQLSIPIVASMVTPPEWRISATALSGGSRDWRASARGYIFYMTNWQPDATQLHKKGIGTEITLHFHSGRPKKFVVQNLFTVGPKSPDRSELAHQPDTMLIYSSTGFADRDRLVLLAKELPAAEVSSL